MTRDELANKLYEKIGAWVLNTSSGDDESVLDIIDKYTNERMVEILERAIPSYMGALPITDVVRTKDELEAERNRLRSWSEAYNRAVKEQITHINRIIQALTEVKADIDELKI